MGFHTTQYDLNIQIIYKIIIYSSSFHTTQYDLNFPHIFFFFVVSEEFPYYIVRFKPTTDKGSTSKFSKFPYYIVRFKPKGRDIRYPSKPQFPYYIVRFKHFEVYVLFENLSTGFHTTQYDLNSVFFSLFCSINKVSILHSTI